MKVFSYAQDGLSYTVTVYEDPDNPGNFKADITVVEGSMDVNAVYWSSEGYDGPSAAPKGGPTNMNGEGSRFDGDPITWEGGEQLSRPGLGREGQNKETFLQAGDTLSVDLDGLDSLDDIDFFGIRATSVNGGGSIKGVSGNPEIEEPEDPEDPEDPEEPDANTYDKVMFYNNVAGGGGVNYEWDNVDPALLEAAGLEPDAEGTFANYVAVWQADESFGIEDLQEIRFWPETPGQFDPALTIEAPEGGFETIEALLDAYEDARSQLQADGFDPDSLQIAVLAEGEGWIEDTDADADENDDMVTI